MNPVSYGVRISCIIIDFLSYYVNSIFVLSIAVKLSKGESLDDKENT